MLRSEDLVGAWELASFHDTDDAGRPMPGPLGADPAGYLLYTPCGHLSVGMMGAGSAPYMGYAGRWRIAGGVLRHLIVVCSRADWVGREQIRHPDLDGDLLTLRDSPGSGRIVTWRRAGAAGTAPASIHTGNTDEHFDREGASCDSTVSPR